MSWNDFFCLYNFFYFSNILSMFKKFIVIFFCLFSTTSVFSWSYPIKEISKPTWKCKFELWKNLGPDCKTTLPALKPSDYKTKNKSLYYRAIFSVLWASSYKYWWDMMHWTHLWVDIASSAWTPVYSIWDWKIVFVWTKSWRWKVVVIRHNLNWKYIFSNYAHLSKIVVVNWQNIKEWQKIWEIWNTWNSFWNHLHFQIDKNQDYSNHPFWFKSCHKGKSIKSVVNSTQCLDEVIQNTLDPIEFLSTNWANINFNQNLQKQIKKHKIDRKWMLSNEEIERKLIADFLKNYNFSFSFENSWVYKLWEYGHFTVDLKDRRWRTFSDILPKEIEIIYDPAFFSAVYPKTVRIIDEKRKISFKTKKTWITFFTLKMWENTIYQKTIRIVNPKNPIKVGHSKIFSTLEEKYIWNSSRWLAVFQDAWYVNILKTPFASKYKLSSSNWIKICKWPNNIADLKDFKCDPSDLVDSFTFDYYDTLYWILLFQFIGTSTHDNRVKITDMRWKTIAKMNIFLNNVKFTNPKTNYKSDIDQACERWLCSWILEYGFIRTDRALNKSEMKYIFRNFLHRLWKNVNINISNADIRKKISRKDFINFLFHIANLKIKDYSNSKTNYLDISNISKNFQNQAKYLEKLGFKRKDQFWQKYFQPNRDITTAEALYLINFLISKYS